MDRNYDTCLKRVLKYEGGWSDQLRDPGGATMKGVTLATFRRTIKKDATKDDLRKITDAQLGVVYRREFWDKIVGAELPDGIDAVTFDFAVNSGPSRAVKYLQGVVGVKQDGLVGPKTLTAIRSQDPGSVIDRLCDARLEFMKKIKHPVSKELLWKTYGKGWSSRVADVRGFAKGLAKQKPEVIVLPAERLPPPEVIVVKDNPPPAIKAPKGPKGLTVLIALILSLIAGFWEQISRVFGG